MRCIDYLRELRKRAEAQRRWVADHGGDLRGYIRHYGDPGIPPLDENGNPKTIRINPRDIDIAQGLVCAGEEGLYYAEHFGSGGTLIYQADSAALSRIEQELAEYEMRYGHLLRQEDARIAAAGGPLGVLADKICEALSRHDGEDKREQVLELLVEDEAVGQPETVKQRKARECAYKLIDACRAMQRTLRSGSTQGKDLSYELELARAALAEAERIGSWR